MKPNTLITLGLTEESPLASALRPFLDRALSIVSDAVFDDHVVEQRQLREQIDGYRRMLATASESDEITAITEPCLAALEQALRQAPGHPLERRQEFATLIALVKDAVALLTGDHDTFSAGLGRTADRFDALLAVPNLQQLRDQLLVETLALRRLVAERQQQWRSSAIMLESRITVLEGQLQVVREEVTRDPLTGIGNRRRFESALASHIGPPSRPFVLAIFDLDDFKCINDTGGHQLGDRVLQDLAHTLERSVRSDDVVARLGGDEFALLASGQTLPQFGHRLRDIVQGLAHVATGLDSPTHVTASCGAVESCAGDTIKSVMSRADEALYEAKRAGKNRVVVKSPPFIRDLLKK